MIVDRQSANAVLARPTDGAYGHPSRNGAARPRQRLEELAGVLVLGLALCVELLLARFGLDAADEGYFVEQATRVLQGQLPYRDFDSLYTPGLLYVHATVVQLFGGSPIIDVRLVGWVARVVLAVGLYLLCRRVLRPWLALVPALFVLVALDRAPAAWEPHPGWPSAALTIVAAWLFTRLPSTRGFRRAGLLVAIGVLVGLVFGFKQNAGILLGLALVASSAWLGLDPDTRAVTRPLRVTQLLLAAVVTGATLWLLRPNASVGVIAYFGVPLGAAMLAALTRTPVSPSGRGILAWFGVLVCLGVGWLVVTLPWLVALLGALDWRVQLVKGFIGAVSQDGLWYPPPVPSDAAWGSVLGLMVALLAFLRWRRRWPLAVVAVVAALVFAASIILLTREPGERKFMAVLLAPGRAAEGLALLLPWVCIVAGVVLSFRPQPAAMAWWLRSMAVLSAITFLTEYPRVDEIHLTWSAGLPLALGTVVLARLVPDLRRRWSLGRGGVLLLVAALAVVPTTVAMRNLGLRTGDLLAFQDLGGGPFQIAPRTTLVAPPTVAGIVTSQKQANSLIAAARFVASNTAPGEPIFVYPTSPLIYVMSDRPNATRFSHLYPGAASPSELQAVIQILGSRPVRLVVVSEADLLFWGPPAKNALLETYLTEHYHLVASFNEYQVFARD